MTSKLIVNSLAADTGVSTITFADQAKMGNAIFHSTGFTIGDSFLHSTGVNITNINATGVITATKFVGEVSVGSSITFEDNEKAYFGTGTDFSIYHNGSASYLHEGGTGGLIVKTNTAFQVFNSAGSQPAFTVTPGGTVDLYHNNSKKFETSSLGITVNGAALVGGNIEINQDAYLKIGASNDLNFTHTGTDSYIQNVTGDLYIQSVGTNSDDIFIDAKDDISIRVQSTENAIKCIGNGAVELYHDNTKRFETTNTGVSVTGTGIFSGDVTVNGDELFIADSIKHVGDTDTSISFPSNDTIRFNTAGSERFRITSSGAVGINTTVTSATKLQVQSDGTSTTVGGNIVARFQSNGSGRDATIQLSDNVAHSATISMLSSALVFKQSGTETLRIYNDGRVAVNQPTGTGAANTGKVHIKSSASNIGQLYLEQNNATDGFILNQDGPNGGHLKFIRNIGGSQTVNVLFRSDRGICFNGDTAAANALDDYEEGTAFTSTGHLTVHQANYTKVGRMCVINWRLSVTAGNSQTISLPFTMVDNHGDHVIGFNYRGSTWEAVFLASSSTVTFGAGFSKGTITYQTQ